MEKSSTLKNPLKITNVTSRHRANLQPLQEKRKHVKKRFNNRVISRRYNLRRRSDAYSNPFRKNDFFDDDSFDQIISESVAEMDSDFNDQKVVCDENGGKLEKTKPVNDSNNNETAAEPPVVDNSVFEEIPKENNIIKTTVISECSNLLEKITSVVAGEIHKKAGENDAGTKPSVFPFTNTLMAQHTKSTNKITTGDEMQVNTAEMAQNKENVQDPPLSPTF